MAWSKSPQSLIDLFTESLPHDLRIQTRKMFGYPAAFVNGNMFAGLFQDQMFVRLAPEDRAALDAEHGAVDFEPLPGRPMRRYACLPEAIMEDEAAVAIMLAKALGHVARLPPKEKKATRGTRGREIRRPAS
ncbi:TfoX/Sxy family protein [Phenylobacterium montanum]|uniref:TfoX/Sxy family protein n=1 Tax=Phenylobacterium montanum TaxID=2823693 RepID=A0A975IWB7_9CAUL|nr:TfoX/Sxy family protein [Caulobacter sp. S6]QUD89912.1 TfoX/Sxy family protein [Caulobacter sp. S6]